MEEKKLDINSIIGFILIFGILVFMMYQNAPTEEEIEAQKQAEQEQVEAEKKNSKQNEAVVTTSDDYSNTKDLDSTQLAALQSKEGSLAYALTLPGEDFTTVETDVFQLKFSRMGGHLTEVKLKKFVTFDSLPIYMVKDQNSAFNITFGTSDNRTRNTLDYPFQPSVSKSGENTIVSMKLKFSETEFLEYRYELKPDDYMIDDQSSLPQGFLPQQPMPTVPAQPAQVSSITQTGLTPTENALLSEEEKQIRLRQRGLG